MAETVCEISREPQHPSARVCAVADTLTRELSSLREKCCDVEGRRTSGENLVEHRLQ